MNNRLLRPRARSGDADALAYIAAVQAADGQTLEAGVRKAINDFVVGCKQDGTWNAIKSCCILAGARTLSGALVPLKGAAVTSVNFVSGDYNRKTGLKGNGSTKYLDSGRSVNADPQNNFHLSAFITDTVFKANGNYIGDFQSGSANFLQMFSAVYFGYARSSNTTSRTGNEGFLGVSRALSTSFSMRGAGSNATVTSTSSTPPERNAFVYAINSSGGVSGHSAARMAFYSIGESVDLATLDSRISSLYTAIGAAIP